MDQQQKTTLKFALIGCGNIANLHIESICKINEQQNQFQIVITALIDPLETSQKKISEKIMSFNQQQKEPTFFKNFEEAAQADPNQELFDTCLGLVPSITIKNVGDLHEVIAAQVFKSNRHLLLEKPVAVTVEAAERIQQNYKNSGIKKVFMIAENAQFWPEVLQVLDYLKQSKIGEVLSIYAKSWESAGGPWGDDYKDGAWRCDSEKFPQDIFFLDSNTHWIRPLRMFQGEFDKVVGLKGSTLPYNKKAQSMLQSIIKYKNGANAVFEYMLAPTAISDQPWFRIQGTLGDIVIDGLFSGGGRVTYVDNPQDQQTKVIEFQKGGWPGSFLGQMNFFVNCLLNKNDTGTNLEDGIQDMRILYTFLKSTLTEQWEKVPDIKKN